MASHPEPADTRSRTLPESLRTENTAMLTDMVVSDVQPPEP